jgi:hypothetical protein
MPTQAGLTLLPPRPAGLMDAIEMLKDPSQCSPPSLSGLLAGFGSGRQDASSACDGQLFREAWCEHQARLAQPLLPHVLRLLAVIR